MTLDRNTIKQKLRQQRLGTPSWGYADSGTRFHTLTRPYAPRNLHEKIEDAAQVQKFTGVCPCLDLHTAWDSSTDWAATRDFAESLGLKIGAINPHLFAHNDYSFGTICNPAERVRRQSLDKLLEGIEIGQAVGSKVLSLWFPDGTDYPGQDNFRKRKGYAEAALRRVYDAMPADMRLVLEYKFFEPAFYHTDLADWGISYILTRQLGDRAGVLVDLGHHALGANVEHIVSILISEHKLGGFHFNDKKYGDDDLTVGSINPYQLFLIYCELVAAAVDERYAGDMERVAYMIDENHNLKPQIEGTIQSVCALQEAYAKALLVDHAALAKAQDNADLIQTEELIKAAYNTDVRPLLAEVRGEMGLAADPVAAFRASGYMKAITAKRT